MNIQTVSHNELQFLNVHDPKDLEIKTLIHEYNFHEIHLDNYVNRQQVSKIEEAEEYVLIVLAFPYFKESTDSPSATTHVETQEKPKETQNLLPEELPIPIPLPQLPFGQHKKRQIQTGYVNFFIGRDYLIILHDEKTPKIDEFFSECQKTLKMREEVMAHGPYYLFYRIVDLLVNQSFEVINEISSTIDKIDTHLLEDKNPAQIVEDISMTRRNMVIFKSMIKPSVDIFSDMAMGKPHEYGNKMRAHWTNIKDHLLKIRYRLEGNKEMLEGISRSHESLLTARTNEIVKVLTMFTAILLPLTLLASIYGMNIIGLPYATDPRGLILILLFMGILAIAMTLAFRFRRWL